MDLYLGVDGGQSSTTAIIGDAGGKVIGIGRAGPCNHVSGAEGRERFTRAIEESISQAARGPWRDLRFRAACLGFSGGPEDKREILAGLLKAEKLVVTTDAEIALSGATAGEPGIVVIAGTGSIAFGRNAAGKTARAGGWGYIFGDEGGAFDIARQALRAILRFEEGWGTPTALTQLLLDATGSASANELMHRLYTDEFPRPRIAEFAKLVDEAGRKSDKVAVCILESAASQLASLAFFVRRPLFQLTESARVAYAGGVFRSEILRGRFHLVVGEDRYSICQPAVYGPAAGALIEAYRATGLKPQLTGAPKAEK